MVKHITKLNSEQLKAVQEYFRADALESLSIRRYPFLDEARHYREPLHKIMKDYLRLYYVRIGHVTIVDSSIAGLNARMKWLGYAIPFAYDLVKEFTIPVWKLEKVATYHLINEGGSLGEEKALPTFELPIIPIDLKLN